MSQIVTNKPTRSFLHGGRALYRQNNSDKALKPKSTTFRGRTHHKLFQPCFWPLDSWLPWWEGC